jgi:putative ABC transport system permease protein
MKSRSGLSLRSGLVVFQFASSLVLIVGTFVVFKQLRFMEGQEKYLTTNQILVVKGPEVTAREKLSGQMMSFKNELLQLSMVDKVAISFNVPASDPSMSSGIRKLGNPVEENRIGDSYWAGPDFMELYQIPLVAGKFWDARIESEMDQVIVNEEAVRVFRLGTNNDALKEKLIMLGDTLSILGVVKNHHWNSLKQLHKPMVFRAGKSADGNVSVRLTGDNQLAIEQIKQTYSASFPGETFSYYFMDDSYQRLYDAEKQFGKLFSSFSILAILIGCLGLWGLASFAMLTRMKEISIRKVLGASANSILFLLTGQFLKPILIGSAIAYPLVWFGANKWLEQFPYRINVSIDQFIIPLAILISIALLTISRQILQTTKVNPVDSLKNE